MLGDEGVWGTIADLELESVGNSVRCLAGAASLGVLVVGKP